MSKSRQALAATALIVVLISAGCSNTPAHTSGTGSSAPATSTGGNRAKAVAFSECMRGQGVSGFPDPDASGALTIDAVANGSSVDTNSGTWKRALDACQHLEPPGFTGTGRTPAQQRAALGFAQCVRNHGVPDFPDPTTQSPLIDTTNIPSTERNGLAALNAATQACRNFSTAAGVTPR